VSPGPILTGASSDDSWKIPATNRRVVSAVSEPGGAGPANHNHNHLMATTYMTRIELHDAMEADYEKLHAAMEAEEFKRTITADDGSTYHLPTAEYYLITELTRDQVFAIAKTVANKTGKKYGIVVVEVNAATWAGLAKAK
jgi:hypothetical protein